MPWTYNHPEPYIPPDEYRKQMERAKRSLLRHARVKVQSSYDLLTKAEKTKPILNGSLVRGAYWSLVSDGHLVREPGGVRKLKKGETAYSID